VEVNQGSAFAWLLHCWGKSQAEKATGKIQACWRGVKFPREIDCHLALNLAYRLFCRGNNITDLKECSKLVSLPVLRALALNGKLLFPQVPSLFASASHVASSSIGRHQGCGVGSEMSDSNSDRYKIPDTDSDFYKISDSDVREWSLAVNDFVATSNQLKSWYTARCFNKSFKICYTISTGIPILVEWYIKWSNWTSGVGQKIRLRLSVLSGIRLRNTGCHHVHSESLVCSFMICRCLLHTLLSIESLVLYSHNHIWRVLRLSELD